MMSQAAKGIDAAMKSLALRIGPAIAVLAAVSVALGQPAPPSGPPPVLDAAARQDIVAKLADALRQRYVFPDVGAKMGDAISTKLMAGGYDSLTNPTQFASQLDADLAAIAHDKHLHVVTQGGGGRPPNLPPPPRSEAGVIRADRLAGGVGYIELSGFPPFPVYKPVIDRAMTALEGSKAIVIDDRRNRGGDPAAVGYFVSFFTPPGSATHINDIVLRQAGTQSFTHVPSMSQPTPVSFAGKPVYLLTSAATISGGEEVAYDLQSLKLATIVGEVTAGGANPTGPVILPSGFIALVPNGRAENPVTKTNWEGVGVHPDIATPAPDAFKTALAKLGQPPALDVASVSQKQVFAPRTTMTPGSDAALRRMLEGVAAGAPDYAMLDPGFAGLVRAQLPQVQAMLSKLGPIQSIKFDEVGGDGGDVFDVTYASATWRFGIQMGADGKISGSQIMGPAPAAAGPPPPR
jgi:hypothetical protein